ncbi:MAG: sigma 54-interacting transcriptional regulator [Deltaproteobacteria bacterium]|nr:sigma 54-interacting transcriptional regulator [Deltaproteobacteria bacterium]
MRTSLKSGAAPKEPQIDQFIRYEQLWSLLVDLRVGVFTVDAHRKITSFNKAAELMTGYKEEEVIGRFCHEVFLNELCYGECKYHEAVLAEQKTLSFDVEIVDSRNERQMVTKIVTPLYDANQNTMGCMEIFQDRSTFEELINRIRYDQQQLKIILNNLDIGILTVTRGNLISFFNTMAESISGFNRKEVLGKPLSTVLGNEAGRSVSLMQQCIETGKSHSNNKGWITSRTGDPIPIRANYMALRNDHGKIVGGLATVQDLSLIDHLSRAISKRYTFADMVGKDPSMQKIFQIIPVIAASEATVLIEGPTGTGKDLLAQVIHNQSNRKNKPMVKVNCAALPDNLLESEMFGYAKGAFTGADKDKPGRFQEADGGTIFLDEIGDLPLSLQAKLLRVLEDKEFYPLGSRKTTKVNVRIIAATNQGLERLVKEKRFREDLFYRLNVIRMEMPPLKQRKGDLPLLIDHIVKSLGARRKTGPIRIAEDAMEILLNHDYPGNIRELENILVHALILCEEGVIERRHLPLSLQKGVSEPAPSDASSKDAAATPHLSERELLVQILVRHHWNRGETARELGIDRTTLWRKMKKYHVLPS